MKNKLTLQELEIKSFKTTEEKKQIGGSIDFPSEPLVCGGSFRCTEGHDCTTPMASKNVYLCVNERF